jgi:hypothetical protein
MAGRQSPALGQVLCPCQQTAPRERPAQPLAGPVVRGRLPGLDGGIGGASRRYLSSLSACLAPTSPTKARLSGIHIATSRNAMPPPESASRALGTTPQATHPDLLKRALSSTLAICRIRTQNQCLAASLVARSRMLTGNSLATRHKSAHMAVPSIASYAVNDARSVLAIACVTFYQD